MFYMRADKSCMNALGVNRATNETSTSMGNKTHSAINLRAHDWWGVGDDNPMRRLPHGRQIGHIMCSFLYTTK